MRKTLIAGNWKMNFTVSEVEKFFKAFKIEKDNQADILFCTPFTDIPITRFFLERSSIEWGAQNVYPADSGAFTGEISAPMLKELGCTYVICGHSERRQILGESDSFIADKVKCVLSHEMIPILCVGETEEERESSRTEERIREELEVVLSRLDKKEMARLVIAYEPIWAIGSGKAATPEDAEKVSAFIRQTVKELGSKKISEEIRILYGGSVNEKNIEDFLREKDIDGGLIGGASLKPESFLAIYNQAKNIRSKH